MAGGPGWFLAKLKAPCWPVPASAGRQEAADGLALGCLAPANKIPRASEPLAKRRDTEGPQWEKKTTLGHPGPSERFQDKEELVRGCWNGGLP